MSPRVSYICAPRMLCMRLGVSRYSDCWARRMMTGNGLTRWMVGQILYGVLRRRLHGVISLSGVCTSTTCPGESLFASMSHRCEILLVFLEPVKLWNIVCRQGLQPRHLAACRG